MSGKRVILTAPRYISTTGQYIQASPDFPVEIELPEGVKPDKTSGTCIEVGKDGKPAQPLQKLKPHFNDRSGGNAKTAAEHFSQKVDGKNPEGATEEQGKEPGGKKHNDDTVI